MLNIIELLKIDRANKQRILSAIIGSLEQNAWHALNEENNAKIRLMLSHYKAFLNKESLLTAANKNTLKFILGSFYSSLKDNSKAMSLLSESLQFLEQKPLENNLKIAKAQTYLAITYNDLNDWPKAKTLLK